MGQTITLTKEVYVSDAENAGVVLEQLVGRPLLAPAQLLKELHESDWPEVCYVIPPDFIALSPYFVATKDEEGYFFLIGATKIRPRRPQTGQPAELDLTDYSGPSRILEVRDWDRTGA